MTIRRLSVWLCLIVPIAAGAAIAQPSDAGSERGSSDPIPGDHASARATMRTFLEAFYQEGGPDLDTAASCLDLSAVPIEVRTLKGRELAVTLKDTLDRIRRVEIESIPDAADGPPHVVHRQREGAIVIAPGAAGEWLFTAETISNLADLHRAVEDRDVVEGVDEIVFRDISPGMWLRSVMPDSLRAKLLFLEGWQWLGVLLIVMVGVVAGRVFVFAVTTFLNRFLRRRETVISGDVMLRTLRPLGALVVLMIWGLGIAWLGLPVSVFAFYYKAVRVVAVAVSVLVAYRLVDVLGEVLERRAQRTDTRFDDLLVPLVRKSLKIFVVAVGVVLVAETVGQDITALIAGLGLGGLAFALAAQDTVGNLFGSLTVLLDRPFQVGDWVIVGDVEGTVEEVGFRSTRIRTFYNSLVTLPNSNLIKASVDNLGERTYRRWKTTLAVTYDTPPEKVDAFCEGVRELIRRHPYTRKDYFHVYFSDFGDASLNLLLYVFFETPDWATELRERHRLGVDILRLAAELGVEFAFPTQTLYLRREEWSAPDAAGSDYPEATRRLTEDGRTRAARLVGDALAGKLPSPVAFDLPVEVNRGELDE